MENAKASVARRIPERILRHRRISQDSSYAKLFDPAIIDLRLLDAPIPWKKNGKCQHLSLSIDCNVGGFGHLGCMDERFHSHCRFKAAHEAGKRRVVD